MNIRTNWKQWLAAGMAVGAIALAALTLAPHTTFAQTDSGSDAQPTEESATAAPWGRGGMKFGLGHGGLGSAYQGYLAEALGITVEELQAAQVKAQDAMIDQAVEDGTLTQEQADLMKARQAFMQYYAEQSEQALEDALSAAVEAGALTQEQADLLLEHQGQMGRGMFGGGFGERGERGGSHHRGMMPGQGGRRTPGAATPTATPEANS